MTECKKRVYSTMCETEKGERHGKYGGVRYESVQKRGHDPAKLKEKQKTKTVQATNTGKNVQRPKTVPATRQQANKAAQARDEAIWKAMGTRVFDNDIEPHYNHKRDEHLDKLEAEDFVLPKTKANKGRMGDDEKRLQTMHLQNAWMKRQASKRKRYTYYNKLDAQIFLSDTKEDFMTEKESDAHLDKLDNDTMYVPKTKANKGRLNDDEKMLLNMYLQDAYMKRQASKRKSHTNKGSKTDSKTKTATDTKTSTRSKTGSAKRK